ncbi:hypothetical protein PV326_002248, partial [Microctonus aethiopoides]
MKLNRCPSIAGRKKEELSMPRRFDTKRTISIEGNTNPDKLASLSTEEEIVETPLRIPHAHSSKNVVLPKKKVEFLLSEDYPEKAGKNPNKNKFLQFEGDSTMSEKIENKTSTSIDVLPDTHVNKPLRYGFATSTPMTEPNIKVRERERKSLSLLSPIPQNQISMEVKRRSSHNREKLIDEKRKIEIDEENLIEGSRNEQDTPLIIVGASEIASRKPQQLIMTTNGGSINNEMEENALT